MTEPHSNQPSTDQAEAFYGHSLIETASAPRLALRLFARTELLLGQALSKIYPPEPNTREARQIIKQAHAVMSGLCDLLSNTPGTSPALLQANERLANRLSNQFRQQQTDPSELGLLLANIRQARALWEQALAIKPRAIPGLNVRRAQNQNSQRRL